MDAFNDVLDFWFLAPDNVAHGAPRKEWFTKDAAFDAQIAQRFGALIEQALLDGLVAWDQHGPLGTLARILVLDQFTRNVYRDTPKAFAGDALALAAAHALVDSGAEQALPARQRAFVYMPFEHAEDAAEQARAVALFAALADSESGFADMLDYAKQHQQVIARFGRFPHRNAILGRASTPDEEAYLRQPGSGF